MSSFYLYMPGLLCMRRLSMQRQNVNQLYLKLAHRHTGTCKTENKIKMLREEKHSYRDNDCDEMIDLLCDNILLEVFSFLNAVDLKKASLVCKRWNEIIGSSTLTMDTFKFKIKNEILRDRLTNFGSNRRHQNYYIHVEDLRDWTVDDCSFDFTRVKSFEISGGRRLGELMSYDLTKVLSKMTKLENFNLNGVRLTVTEECMERITLSQLKSLTISRDYSTILESIDASELQELQCMGCCSSFEDYKSIANSLIKFSKIKHLTVRNCMEIFEHIDINQIKLKLISIDVYHINVDPVEVNKFDENLQKFLMLQRNSLRELKFDFSMSDVADGERIVNNFLQIAFNKCTNLLSLDIRNLSIPHKGDFYLSLSPNQSLKTLNVHWNFEGEVIEGLLRNSPNLHKLQAEFCNLTDDGINSIAKFCRKLTHLDTFKLTGIVKDNAVFENLQFLHISKIEKSFDPLISVVCKSPQIKEIRIDECTNAEAIPIDLIRDHPSIGKLVIMDKCYYIVTSKENLRIIEMSQFKLD